MPLAAALGGGLRHLVGQAEALAGEAVFQGVGARGGLARLGARPGGPSGVGLVREDLSEAGHGRGSPGARGEARVSSVGYYRGPGAVRSAILKPPDRSGWCV